MPGPAPRVDRDEFARLNAEGWTIPRLAAHFGIAPRTVTSIRSKLGLRSPNTRDLTPERLAHIEALLDDGLSFKEIHRTEGADMETLAKHFPGRGWTIEQANEHRATIRQLQPRIRRTYGRAAA